MRSCDAQSFAKRTGVTTNDVTAERRTPPAIATAKGGQKPPPAKMSGRKPAKVVIVVDAICRTERPTTCTIALRILPAGTQISLKGRDDNNRGVDRHSDCTDDADNGHDAQGLGRKGKAEQA